MPATRAQAYLAALCKTEGRAFDLKGQPALTAVEARVVAEAEKADFAEAFRRAISVRQAMLRLDAIFAHGAKTTKARPPREG